MFRRLMSLVLVLQLLVPARALSLLTPPPPPDAKTAVPAVKMCPCSGNAVCKCSGCCSEEEESGESEVKGQESDNANQPRQGSSPQLRCRCNTPESMQPDGEIFSYQCGLGIAYYEPPQIGTLSYQTDAWKSLTSPVDTPPPRNPA